MASATVNPSIPRPVLAAEPTTAASTVARTALFGPSAPPGIAAAVKIRETTRRPASRSVERKARPATPRVKRQTVTRHRVKHRVERTSSRRAAAVRSGWAGAMLAFAYRQLGEPYRWGADGPGSWDCSGLTQRSAARAGIRLPHNAAAQGRRGRAVSRRDARPGDLVLWGDYHVGLYVGRGRVLHAPKPGDHVRISALWGSPRFRRIA